MMGWGIVWRAPATGIRNTSAMGCVRSGRFAVVPAKAGSPGDNNHCDVGSSGSASGAVPIPFGSVDHAKEYVMACLPHLVRDGVAEWDMLGNGEIELRFRTGETYLLGKDVVTRTA
jgi:hypothetical protein